MADVTTAPPSVAPRLRGPGDMPIYAIDLPVIYEDEGQEEMGDSLPHYTAESILYFGIMAHLIAKPELQVLPNMNLYYHPIDRVAYVSPDVMVVRPNEQLPRGLRTYRIGEQGPAPVLALEVLSRRTFQQGDLTTKMQIYADLGVAEYILVDTTSEFMPERLRLRRLDRDKIWSTELDRDGGVTSDLGFRVVIEHDGEVRVVDRVTGRKYARPDEAQAEANARIEAERAAQSAEEARRSAEEALRLALERSRELEAELAKLKRNPPKP